MSTTTRPRKAGGRNVYVNGVCIGWVVRHDTDGEWIGYGKVDGHVIPKVHEFDRDDAIAFLVSSMRHHIAAKVS